MSTTTGNYQCPVCGWEKLEGPPTQYRICPSCGTEFENDDADRSHEELRDRWITEGCRWWAVMERPPRSERIPRDLLGALPGFRFCQAEDQGGWPCCDREAVYETKSLTSITPYGYCHRHAHHNRFYRFEDLQPILGKEELIIIQQMHDLQREADQPQTELEQVKEQLRICRANLAEITLKYLLERRRSRRYREFILRAHPAHVHDYSRSLYQTGPQGPTWDHHVALCEKAQAIREEEP